MKRTRVDVCAKYNVLIGEAIPKLVEKDKILEQAMKALVARGVRSKYSADPIPPKKPTAECPPVTLAREMPMAEELSPKNACD